MKILYGEYDRVLFKCETSYFPSGKVILEGQSPIITLILPEFLVKKKSKAHYYVHNSR